MSLADRLAVLPRYLLPKQLLTSFAGAAGAMRRAI